jgi:hypothetical protein
MRHCRAYARFLSPALALWVAGAASAERLGEVVGESHPLGLLLAASRFDKASGDPPASELAVLTFEGGTCRVHQVRDPASKSVGARFAQGGC